MLLSVQDRKPGEIGYECPLRKEVQNGSIYPRPEGSYPGQNQSIFKPRVKTKVFLNLTKRQLICFGLAALIGVPSFFFIKSIGSTSLAAMSMIIIMIPMFLLAMYERDGQPLEVIAKHFIESKFIRPKIRPYQTDNYYDVLKRAAQAEKEVDRIVSAVQRKKK